MLFFNSKLVRRRMLRILNSEMFVRLARKFHLQLHPMPIGQYQMNGLHSIASQTIGEYETKSFLNSKKLF